MEESGLFDQNTN